MCTQVWGVILLQSFGGLNVAFILRYADNILKGFAAAFSTVASCLLEVVFFGFQPSASFLCGAVLINTAAYMYNTPGRSPQFLERLFASPEVEKDKSTKSPDV